MNINIDIKNLENLREELENIEDEDTLYINTNGIPRFAVVPIDRYDKAVDLLSVINDDDDIMPRVKIIGEDSNLSYEEYERIKALIMDAVEKTFKPKAEKLN